MKIIAKNPNGVSVSYNPGGVNLRAFIPGDEFCEFGDDTAKCIIEFSDGQVEEYTEPEPKEELEPEEEPELLSDEYEITDDEESE